MDLVIKILSGLVFLAWVVVWATVLSNFEKANGHRPLLHLILRIGELHIFSAGVFFFVVLGASSISWYVLLGIALLALEAVVTYILGRRVMGQNWRGHVHGN